MTKSLVERRIEKFEKKQQRKQKQHRDVAEVLADIVPKYKKRRTNSEARREISHRTIAEHSKLSGTKQAFGTGRARQFGKANHKTTVSTRARKLLHLVDRSIEQSKSDLEILQRLTAVSLIAPDVYRQALSKAPRLGTRTLHVIGIKPATLIRPEILAEPTIEEIAAYKCVPPYLVEEIKQSHPEWWRNARWDYAAARMTNEELSLATALQYHAAREMFDNLARQYIKL